MTSKLAQKFQSVSPLQIVWVGSLPIFYKEQQHNTASWLSDLQQGDEDAKFGLASY
jgi:hypothetical protein